VAAKTGQKEGKELGFGVIVPGALSICTCDKKSSNEFRGGFVVEGPKSNEQLVIVVSINPCHICALNKQ
jgi:hypothetical protein